MSKLLCNVVKISGEANAPNATPGCALDPYYLLSVPFTHPKKGIFHWDSFKISVVKQASVPSRYMMLLEAKLIPLWRSHQLPW